MTETPGSTPEPPRDDLSRSMDDWQLECAGRLQGEYGHDWSTAHRLAAFARWDLEIGLRKPGPLVIVTGV